MSRDMTLGALQVSAPIWAGSFIDSDDLLPGGAKLDTTPAFTVTATAAEAAGATTVAVAPLPYALASGTVLDFGGGKTATLTAAAAAGATSLTVSALPVALVGTESTTVPTAFPAVTAPAFAVTTTAAEAIGATSIAVAALPYTVLAGTVLNFGVPGKLAFVTLTAAAGATSLTVSALSVALILGDTATVPATRGSIVQSGTVVSRTIGQRDAKLGFHTAVATDDEIFIVAFDISDVQNNADVDLVMPGDFVVKENFLPGFAGLTPALVTKLRGLYILTVGRP